MTQLSGDLKPDRASRFHRASSWFTGDHGRALSQLWFVSVAVSGLNFISTILIIARTSAMVFAEYTVAFSVMTIAAALVDGGLASTVGVLAVDQTPEGLRFKTFSALLREYRRKVLAIGLFVSVALAVIVGRNSAPFRDVGTWRAVLPFVVAGAVMALNSQLNSLLYARGRFTWFGTALLVPAILRTCLVAAGVVTLGTFTLSSLFVITLASTLLGFLCSSSALNREFRRHQGPVMIGIPARRELKTFLAPTATATILNSLSYQVTAVGGSFYAGGSAIATYGVFTKGIQIMAMLFTPASAYVGRHLRSMGDSPSREATENRYLLVIILSFALYAGITLIVYRALGQHYNHYALGQTAAYSVFVLYSGLGCCQVTLDGILAARGRARHRIPGALMLCILNTFLIPIVRPSTIWSLVLIDATTMVPIVGYYWWELFVARRATPDRQVPPSPSQLVTAGGDAGVWR